MALLKQHDVYRGDDVTFDGLEGAACTRTPATPLRWTWNCSRSWSSPRCWWWARCSSSFCVRATCSTISCVLHHRRAAQQGDLLYATESTGVVVGGDLRVDHIAYLDCGSSALQVNGDLHAKLSFNAQCSVEVRGEEHVEFDESVESPQRAASGLEAGDGVDDAACADFDKYDENC